MLEEERRFFDENLPRWLATSAGRFVLIHGRELVGTFSTVDEALDEGARRFGLNPFLVRQVVAAQSEIMIPALTLGLISADSTRPI